MWLYGRMGMLSKTKWALMLTLLVSTLAIVSCNVAGDGVKERQLCCYPPIYECHSTIDQRRMSKSGMYTYPSCHCAVVRLGSRVYVSSEVNCLTGARE